jgi:hypothetical protein
VRRETRRRRLSEKGRDLRGDRVGLGRELAPGDADDPPAGDDERSVPGAVLLERLAGAVGGPAVHFDDEPLLGPDGIELAVVGEAVDAGPWQSWTSRNAIRRRSRSVRVNVAPIA